MVGFISSSRFIDHDTGPSHPERPDRIRAIATAVRQAGLLDSPNPFPNFHMDFGASYPPAVEMSVRNIDAGSEVLRRAGSSGAESGSSEYLRTGVANQSSLPKTPSPLLELPEPAPADEKWLRLVHPQTHIDRIRDICNSGGGILDGGDTPVSAHSFDIAKLGVGALLQACDVVIEGKVKRAFAAIRPPGHHAEPDRAMGFCLFANVSIAARYLQRHHGIGKVAIVDFDVHHGNGTQAVFEADPSVLFVSLHQSPQTCYPGTGYADETGVGNIVNLPMDPGAVDAEYLGAFDARVLPAIDAFKPEMLLISAGFDAHRDDPLAQIDLSEECFESMTKLLVQAANVHCGGAVSTLEGGYNLLALGRSVVRHLRGMGGA